MCTIPPPSSLNLDWWLLLCTNDDSHEWRLTLGNDNTHHVYSLFLLFPFFLLSIQEIEDRDLSDEVQHRRGRKMNQSKSLSTTFPLLSILCLSSVSSERHHESWWTWNTNRHDNHLNTKNSYIRPRIAVHLFVFFVPAVLVRIHDNEMTSCL